MAHQAYLWAYSLLKYANRQPNELVVHYIEGCEAEYVDRLKPLGVRLVPVKTFDPRHLPSNKLTQLGSALLGQADYVVLTDCDIAFTDDISEILAGDQVRAKVVDNANLKPAHWRAIFKAAELGEPDLNALSTNDHKPTLPNFCNGGLLVLPRGVYEKLGPVWTKWNRWLIDHPERLDDWTYYTDQVSFALALQELQETVDHVSAIYNYALNTGGNFSLHKGKQDKEPLKPKVLHYHGEFDSNGYLSRIGGPEISQEIDRVNSLIETMYQSGLSQESLARKSHDLLVKRRLLQYVIDQLAPLSVLEVGFGDLEMTRELKIDRYLGIDGSPAAIAQAKAKRHYWSFQSGDILNLDLEPRDLVICFDLTTRQASRETYLKLCKRLCELSTRYLIIAGYNQPPWRKVPRTFYHEQLSETLRAEMDGDVSILGGYRDITVLLWSRNGPPEWKDDSQKINQGPSAIRKLASRAKRVLMRFLARATRLRLSSNKGLVLKTNTGKIPFLR